jgi:hypothetical protein
MTLGRLALAPNSIVAAISNDGVAMKVAKESVARTVVFMRLPTV